MKFGSVNKYNNTLVQLIVNLAPDCFFREELGPNRSSSNKGRDPLSVIKQEMGGRNARLVNCPWQAKFRFLQTKPGEIILPF